MRNLAAGKKDMFMLPSHRPAMHVPVTTSKEKSTNMRIQNFQFTCSNRRINRVAFEHALLGEL